MASAPSPLHSDAFVVCVLCCAVRVCVLCVQSELTQWRTLFIFSASAHLISALCFVLQAVSHHRAPPTSTAPDLDPAHLAPPTDYEAPPSAGPDNDDYDNDENNTSEVDSDTEYGSVGEFLDPAFESGKVTSEGQVSRSSDDSPEGHLGQLMESIL